MAFPFCRPIRAGFWEDGDVQPAKVGSWATAQDFGGNCALGWAIRGVGRQSEQENHLWSKKTTKVNCIPILPEKRERETELVCRGYGQLVQKEKQGRG